MNHLYDMEMSWFQHAKVAWKMCFKLLLLTITAFLHGLFPFIFINTTTQGIKKLNEEL